MVPSNTEIEIMAKVPTCLICFYQSADGSLPPSTEHESLEEAYRIVCVRDKDVECVMLYGDVLDRKMAFKSYEAYQQRKASFKDPQARAIFHRIVGEYKPEMRHRFIAMNAC